MAGELKRIAALCFCLGILAFSFTDSLGADNLHGRRQPTKRLPANQPAFVQGNLVDPSKMKNGLLYREGEVLVKFKKGMKALAAQTILSANALSIKTKFPRLSRIKKRDYALIRAKNLRAAELLDLLSESSLFEKVSLNYVKHLNEEASCGGWIPADTRFGDQWALCNAGQDILGSPGTADADIDATEAWDIQTGSRAVVAVLDTGIDYLHPDLDENVWVNLAESGGTEGTDDDGNGYVDDIYGIDTADNDTDPIDPHGHGTHVAGVIAAEGNNNLGVTGINWHGKVMAVKGFGANGIMYTDDELEAIDYIIDMKQRGVNIVAINASYGCYDCFDPIEKEAIAEAGRAGIAFVAAAGNSGADNDISPHYPSSYDLPNVIAVAATNKNDDLAYFTSFGVDSVDLGAPGSQILSTYCWYNGLPEQEDALLSHNTAPLTGKQFKRAPDENAGISPPGRGSLSAETEIGLEGLVHGYAYGDGTSMAAPHVSGAVALMAEAYPGEGMNKRILRIFEGVDLIASLADTVATHGRLNLHRALLLDTCLGDIDNDGDVDANDFALLAADFDTCTGDCIGDIVPDGHVDLNDLKLFLADFGRTDCH